VTALNRRRSRIPSAVAAVRPYRSDCIAGKARQHRRICKRAHPAKADTDDSRKPSRNPRTLSSSWFCSSIPRQLPAAPMRVFPIGVKHPLNVTVQRPHDPDPREHRWSARRHD